MDIADGMKEEGGQRKNGETKAQRTTNQWIRCLYLLTGVVQAELRNSTNSDRYRINIAGQMHSYSHQHVLLFYLISFSIQSRQKCQNCQNCNFSWIPSEYTVSVQLSYFSYVK